MEHLYLNDAQIFDFLKWNEARNQVPFCDSQRIQHVRTGGTYQRLPAYPTRRYVLFPVNYPEARHWALVVADTRERKLVYLDSIPGGHLPADYLRAIQYNYPACAGWPVQNRAFSRQTNAYDCGVHVLHTAFCYSMGFESRRGVGLADDEREVQFREELASHQWAP